jgi:hypothetical protein
MSRADERLRRTGRGSEERSVRDTPLSSETCARNVEEHRLEQQHCKSMVADNREPPAPAASRHRRAAVAEQASAAALTSSRSSSTNTASAATTARFETRRRPRSLRRSRRDRRERDHDQRGEQRACQREMRHHDIAERSLSTVAAQDDLRDNETDGNTPLTDDLVVLAPPTETRSHNKKPADARAGARLDQHVICSGGSSWPWQRGQSGHASPEPVVRTMPPR